MKLFDDIDVVDFLNKNNLTKDDANNYIAEISMFLEDKDHLELFYNGFDISVESKSFKINEGIDYIESIHFNRNITLAELDVKTNPSKMEVLKEYAQNNKNGFYLYGKNHVGKTSFAVGLCNLHYNDTKEKTLFVFWPEFIEKSTQFKNSNFVYINKVKYCKRLIIDDLGQESVSQWTRDSILRPIITHRLEKGLTTIITSNYTIEELNKLYATKDIESKKVKGLTNKIAALSKPFTIYGKNYRNE